MATNNPRPDASMPTEVAGRISDEFGLHAKGSSNFRQSGEVFYTVVAWDKADPRAENVSDISQMMIDAGYNITQMKMVQGNDSLKIKAEASVEN